MKKIKRILVAPLDWGLGHATRCIPIIDELLRRDVDVIIAADHRPLDLLKKEFPHLTHVRFPGYVVQYIENGNLGWAIIKQLPDILRGFKEEHRRLEELIVQYDIDAVISDSRFGVYSKKIPSIFLIHQLTILLPPNLQWAQRSVARVNRFFINRFHECWIPDVADENNLAGILSHSPSLPNNAYYIGPLSRLQRREKQKIDFDLLVVLSGPEPQRTIFEDIIIEQLKQTSCRALLVRGVPERNTRIKLTDTITAVSSLSTEELSKAIAASSIILSRPGYSTIMDLSFVGANAIFVPTPQQTEQEYLAKNLKEKKICYSESQAEFDLIRSLESAKDYTGFPMIHNDPPRRATLQHRIDNLLMEMDERT